MSEFSEQNTNVMSTLSNKNIILGVTGSIAAYKAAELLRLLQAAGATVRVVMTPAATEFVAPLTFQALSGFPVHQHLLDEEAEAGMGHIELARWGDALVIAPASANSIAGLAQGSADTLLSALSLATTAPVAVAPAMNQHMWINSVTQDNIATLKKRQITILGPDEGEQACGDIGPGRMLQPQAICQAIEQLFRPGSLNGVRVLVSAGPTREALDPVRYLSNRSSGKMGFALARAAVEAGAHCTLVSGPVFLQTPEPNKVKRIDVVSAAQMHEAVLQQAPQHHIFISAAAVADYRPVSTQTQKMKKSSETLTLELQRNPDILSDVAQQFPQVFTVGFAAETQDLEQYAQDKLHRKNLNMIAANLVGEKQGFDAEDNALNVYWIQGEEKRYEAIAPANKSLVARQLIALIAAIYKP
ncbi:MAG: bifunctional phosphopantothenoylcysteine decarboxylase/phosphopantothenate--cysteine ligase CoaBC [Gammaproteobacteria bacterium]|nr:bifunctional phosphopantothenoylcysteine decarboxylase/phosphopantothenate--cysteine ligase CoaBC [Gammaproteobacteria bacterium]MDH5799560.1 bifunctional phosphopantothenoylcysteine decarboxylase/phosphopantothenate--cysteine ligase CoaBC [Gammaproteobacteria bacterium]